MAHGGHGLGMTTRSHGPGDRAGTHDQFHLRCVLLQGGTKQAVSGLKRNGIDKQFWLHAVNALEPATKVAGTGGVTEKGAHLLRGD